MTLKEAEKALKDARGIYETFLKWGASAVRLDDALALAELMYQLDKHLQEKVRSAIPKDWRPERD